MLEFASSTDAAISRISAFLTLSHSSRGTHCSHERDEPQQDRDDDGDILIRRYMVEWETDLVERPNGHHPGFELAKSFPLVTPPTNRECIEQIEDYAKAGCREFMLTFTPKGGLWSTTNLLEQIRLFQQVLSSLD
jgi:hypothetical protein